MEIVIFENNKTGSFGFQIDGGMVFIDGKYRRSDMPSLEEIDCFSDCDYEELRSALSESDFHRLLDLMGKINSENSARIDNKKSEEQEFLRGFDNWFDSSESTEQKFLNITREKGFVFEKFEGELFLLFYKQGGRTRYRARVALDQARDLLLDKAEFKYIKRSSNYVVRSK